MDNDTTTTPETPSDASLEAALYAQGAAFDRGETVDTPAATDQQPSPAPDTTQRSDAPAATNQQPPEKAPAPAAAPSPDPKSETPYQQKRTDAQRNADAWKKLEADKAKFLSEREQFYREQAERARQSAPQQQPDRTKAEENPLARYSAEKLEEAANEFDRQGKFDLAEEARIAARAKREQPQAAPAQQQVQPPQGQDPATVAAHAEWEANKAAAFRENPELTQPDSPLRKELSATLQAYPHLRSYPQGISHAVELVKTIREAKAAAGLRIEVAQMKERLSKAEARLAPASGSPESGLRSRSIGDLNDAEAERELLRMAAEQDAAR